MSDTFTEYTKAVERAVNSIVSAASLAGINHGLFCIAISVIYEQIKEQHGDMDENSLPEEVKALIEQKRAGILSDEEFSKQASAYMNKRIKEAKDKTQGVKERKDNVVSVDFKNRKEDK